MEVEDYSRSLTQQLSLDKIERPSREFATELQGVARYGLDPEPYCALHRTSLLC